jgi:hypothetical protein
MRHLPWVLAATSILTAQTPDAEFFEKRVRPLFASKCYGCHGDKVKMGGLSLSTDAGLAHAVQTGVITKNDTEHSRLYRAVLYTDSVKMPPAGKLAAEEIETLRTWIESGAHLPSAPVVQQGTKSITADDRNHWAFKPIRKPQTPEPKQKGWARTPIDRFILSKLEEKGLQPAPAASKLTLLRRVTFDLTGLPPTLDEISAFEKDEAPDAFAKVVDRLLASPRYGERWGRHWLDVARYADSTGMDEDNLYPHAWRYRDYVVRAFNEDTPYNEFIKQQLAGDLLPARSPEERARNIVATGFLAIGPKPLAQQDRVQMIYDVVDEQIDTTTKAFLGLTVACARCHDHKFDPIPTADYYGLASIFASTTAFRNQGRPGAISFLHYTPLDQAAYDRYQTHRWQTLAKQMEMEDVLAEDTNRENALLRSKLADYLSAAWKVQFRGASLDAAASEHNLDHGRLRRWSQWLASRDEKARSTYLKDWYAASAENIEAVAARYQEDYTKSGAKWDTKLEAWRTRYAKESLQDRVLPDRPTFSAEDDPFFAATTFGDGPMALDESARVQLLRSEWKRLVDTMPKVPELASAVSEGPSVDQRVFVRGNLHSPGEPVAKHFPQIISGSDNANIANGSGRLELAEWLTSPENPLTARVMVNRIWQGHFGEALVRTANNWGKTGEPPADPDLLDYLATRFIEGGWSIKNLHREILLSSVYQMTSKGSKKALEADPGNRLWSRFNRVRMSVEQIRDALLSIDNSLDTTMGGSLFPTGKGKRERVEVDELKRRSLYMPLRRGNLPSLFSTFDFGDATTPGDGRTRTNVAPQALFLMNSQFVNDRSRGLAERLLTTSDVPDAARIREAYLTVLTRQPDAAEIDSALTYIASLQKRLMQPDARAVAWSSFCHILAASNEFLYLD